MSPKDIVSRSGLPKLQAARALYALLVLGFLVALPGSERPKREPAVPIPPPAPEAPPSAPSEDSRQFEEEIRRLLELAEKGTHYDLLGLSRNSSPAQIHESFQQLARKFHPDRHMGQSERIGLLQDLMDRVTSAYKTLADDEKRAGYDKQLAATRASTHAESKTESQQTADECFNLAKQCLRTHDLTGSILWLRKCVAISPEVAQYHAILARSLAGLPQYRQEAVQHFEKAIDLDPWNTSVYFQFAELYEVMRQPWRAIRTLRKILQIDPSHSKARDRLCALESSLKEKRE